jgi:hypothetical protein
MQHDFVGVLGVVSNVSFTPIISNSIRKDRAVSVECSSGDSSSYGRISFQSVFSILVPGRRQFFLEAHRLWPHEPEVKGSVRTSSRECSVGRMEGNRINTEDVRAVVGPGSARSFSVALEGKVHSEICQ